MSATEQMLRIGDHVYDSWWPWRHGRISRKTRSTVHVHWVSGDRQHTWIYDRSHQQFLKRIEPRKDRRT